MVLNVEKNPCSSCPYRTDTPSGVWERSEYEKLPGFDTNENLGIFICHHHADEHDTVCRGWLSVHTESVAARLAVLNGVVTDEQRYAPVTVELHPDGRTAAEAGLADVAAPSEDAQSKIRQVIAGRDKRAARHRTPSR